LLLAFIKKDLLHLFRDKKEVMILVAMPFVLITILGFALGSVMQGETKLNIEVAVVNQGDFTRELILFEDWMNEQKVPEAARGELLKAADNSSLPEVLVDQVMKENLQDFLKVTELASVNESIKSDDYAAILVFPENYRLYSWKQQFFDGNEETANLELLLNEEKGFEASVVSNLVKNFTDQMRLYTVIAKESQLINQAPPDFSAYADIQGQTVTLEGGEPISSFQYFAIGMSVMFALYVVSFVAGYAFTEKKSYVYDRILLADTSPWVFGASKWLSAVIVSMMQLSVLFGLCGIVYKVHWPNLLDFFVITIMFSFVIGSLAVLITALNYRLDTERVSSMFSSFLVSIFAFLGGSFTSWKGVSETLWWIGTYTPNGAALEGYLHVLSGGGVQEIQNILMTLAIMSVLLLLLAMSLFPKRRLN
jgi:ABC-2 type transport system permease protein